MFEPLLIEVLDHLLGLHPHQRVEVLGVPVRLKIPSEQRLVSLVLSRYWIVSANKRFLIE